MGGNAIKSVYTRRYQREEFDAIVPDILEKAKTLFSDAVATTFYRTKDSFGDADILCLVDKPIDIDIKQWIIDTYQSKEIVQNTSVYSFEYKELQVDLILVSKSNWETTKTYMSYNDVHNLVGKIAHKFGLKWGQEGLKYVYRIDGKVLGEIVVSTNTRESLTFLGFNADTYENGFDTLLDIFNFIETSKFFNPWQFDLANLNKINRDRDKKRKTYNEFLKHIEHYKQLPLDNFHYFYADKKVYLGLIDYHFPGFLKQYRELEKKEEYKRSIHAIFNGNLIMDYFPELSGPTLGTAITNFYKYYASKEEAELKILELTQTDQVMALFARINNLTFEYKG